MPEVSTSRIGSRAELQAQLALELRVGDLAASIGFYELAGFVLERRTENFAALRLDDRYLLLSLTPDAKAGPTPPNLRVIVADVASLPARMAAAGVDIRHPLADRGYGLRDFTVADPDGYEVRFAQVTA